MIKYIKKFFKKWFGIEEEMDPHAELYLTTPEPEISVQDWPCNTHKYYRKSCKICQEISK